MFVNLDGKFRRCRASAMNRTSEGASTRRSCRVVIPEAIPSKNKGEAAILEGIIESLKLGGPFDLTVYSPPSWLHDDTINSRGLYQVVSGLNLFGFASTALSRCRAESFKPWGILLLFSLLHCISKRLACRCFRDSLLQSFSDADIILAGHDGMLTPEHFYLAFASRILGRPLALFGGSHGMQGRRRFRIRKYLQCLIKWSFLVTVRDSRAKAFFVENDVPAGSIEVFPDPAVLLRPCEDDRVHAILEKERVACSSLVPLFGLIPVGGGIVFDSSFVHERDRQRKHRLRVELWRDLVMHLLNATPAHFLFLPHCVGPGVHNDDRLMSRDVYDAIPHQSDRLTLIETEYPPDELKGLMRRCEFVVGERAHGLIGAASAGTPCFALTTTADLRMHEIVNGTFGLPTYNLDDPDGVQLARVVADAWSRRDETRSALIARVAAVRAEALRAAHLLNSRIAEATRGHA